jgi:hypothetical protein
VPQIVRPTPVQARQLPLAQACMDGRDEERVMVPGFLPVADGRQEERDIGF